jgi:hypothetical protein
MVLRPPPTVTPWMVAPHQPVQSAASVLRQVAEQIDGAGRTLQTVLDEAGGVMGWRSAGAQSARVPLVQAGSGIGQLRDVLGRAAMQIHSLGATMAEHGPPLKQLMARRAELALQAGEYATRPATEVQRATDEIDRIDPLMRQHIEFLGSADRAARDELTTCARLFTALGDTAREDDWVGDMAPPEIVSLLARYGITESAAERGLLDKIMLMPSGPEGDKELRALLGQMTPEELADFLLRHPDVARRLMAPLGPPGSYPADSPEALLATALAAGKSLPPKDRIAAIRAAFARMSPEEQQRMALLYPGIVGNLDGAPLDLRMTANRVAIGVALDDERTKRVQHERNLAARTDWEKNWGYANNHDNFRLVKEFDDADSDAKRTDDRVEYYQKLLYEEVEQPGGPPGRVGDSGSGDVAYDQHQILYFDPTGDGQIAEMWGFLGPDTRNVAVFVPGTTADLENFGSDSNKMRKLAEQDPTGQTVTITWLGTNMPDAIAANATNAKYAEEGGPKFRDFVWGLDIPPEKRVTAIGHSYGGSVVGVADREGLEVDVVFHIASAGTGRGVDSAADYPDGVDGKERYSMTAPGDSIEYAQGNGIPDLPFGIGGPKIGHGSDPDETEGFVRLDTGRFNNPDDKRNGEMVEGFGAHTDVTRPGSTAWDNIYGVVTGGEVTTYTPHTYRTPPHGNPLTPWGNDTAGREVYPYDDPNFEGPKHDIPDTAGR